MFSVCEISSMASSSALKLLKIIISLGRGFITSHMFLYLPFCPSSWMGLYGLQSKTHKWPEVFENKNSMLVKSIFNSQSQYLE